MLYLDEMCAGIALGGASATRARCNGCSRAFRNFLRPLMREGISTSEISLLGVASSEIALEADPVHFTHSHPLGEHRRLSRAAPGDPHGAAPACADGAGPRRLPRQ